MEAGWWIYHGLSWFVAQVEIKNLCSGKFKSTVCEAAEGVKTEHRMKTLEALTWLL